MPKRKSSIYCKICGQEFHGGTNSFYCETCRFLNKICIVCGKPFTCNRVHETHTCSNECGAKFRWKDAELQRGANRPPCSFCGRPITRKCMNSGQRKPEYVFCSIKCYGQWRSINIRGLNHPNWIGGSPGYYGTFWRKQRTLARKRDKICQKCGMTPEQNGKALDAHHIRPFREFGFEHLIEAHSLDNLICYCVSCHQFVEWELNKHN